MGGMSILALSLVVSGMASALILAQSDLAVELKARDEREQLRHMIRVSESCSGVVFPSPCRANQRVSLLDRQGRQLTSLTTNTTLGGLQLRTVCLGRNQFFNYEFSENPGVWLPLFSVPRVCP